MGREGVAYDTKSPIRDFFVDNLGDESTQENHKQIFFIDGGFCVISKTF